MRKEHLLMISWILGKVEISDQIGSPSLWQTQSQYCTGNGRRVVTLGI